MSAKAKKIKKRRKKKECKTLYRNGLSNTDPIKTRSYQLL